MRRESISVADVASAFGDSMVAAGLGGVLLLAVLCVVRAWRGE